MNIKLEDIAPMDATYTLSNGKEYTVRKFDLLDNTWIQSEFGEGDALETALRNPMAMIRVAFHQMPSDQKKEFAAIDREVFNDDTGENVKSKIGGWPLFGESVVGPKDIQAISNAIVKAMVGSSPIADEISKNAIEKQKNAKKKHLAGVKSSI